jgi:hypothetical protein
MTDVTDFIGAAVADKPVAALKAFGAAMEPRITDALNTRYNEVSQTVFNPQVEAEDEAELAELEVETEEELETEMEEPQDV